MLYELGRSFRISTHALTEGDRVLMAKMMQQVISTHALTEGDGDDAR